MGRRWIVDASNVVGSRPDGWWRDRARALHRLLDEIARWRDAVGEPVLVVADGHPSAWVPEGTLRGVHVRYAHSSARDAADDEIARIVARHDSPETLVVATSDRDLGDRVRDLGASVEGAGRFRARLEDIAARRSDRSVLDAFGVDETALLGRGGEARVFALDEDTVLRLPHPTRSGTTTSGRRPEIQVPEAGVGLPFEIPETLEERTVEGRTVILERRLPGRNALEALAERGTDRAALIRSHLDAADAIASLPCPTHRFGELWGPGAITAPSFREWATARLRASLEIAEPGFDHLDAAQLTDEVARALDIDAAAPPVLVHLDAFLGNMLATGSRITAVLDFGPMTIGGPRGLDAAAAVAYLAPEITPTATGSDRDVARAWADETGLSPALEPVERWLAAYWTAAPDDERLRSWCRRVLLARTP